MRFVSALLGLARRSNCSRACWLVLVASFFLQLFALITPLFTQVVIGKVLVLWGFTTLDVLVIGLAALGVFEIVLNGLPTYIFSLSTSHVDALLGARRQGRHSFRTCHLPISARLGRGAEGSYSAHSGGTGGWTCRTIGVGQVNVDEAGAAESNGSDRCAMSCLIWQRHCSALVFALVRLG